VGLGGAGGEGGGRVGQAVKFSFLRLLFFFLGGGVRSIYS